MSVLSVSEESHALGTECFADAQNDRADVSVSVNCHIHMNHALRKERINLLFLAEPSVTYRDSFIQSVLEFQAEGRRLHYDLKSMTSDFGSFVQELLYQKDRARLKPGRVLASEFWLIDDNEFIGRLSPSVTS